MTTTKERITSLEVKVKILLGIAGAQLGINLFPIASAACIHIVENITKGL